MQRKAIQRRLAAILAADVVGYSRLMGADEVGTLTTLKAHRRELVDPAIAGHSGRIVKTTGDGVLVEFGSVVDAVGCALAVQRGMMSRNAAVPEGRRIVFRVGINVGDIIIDGDDIFGDGVNIAARLQTLCEPGGLCISRTANDQIRDKLSLAFADLGEQTVKNISRAIGVFGLGAKEIEALPELELPQSPTTGGGLDAPQAEVRFEQEIQFCTSQDGIQLAYSRIGRGPPLVKTGNWMTHLEFDFESPIWRHLYRELSRDHTLIRYDARGNGLSDREVEEVSYEAFVRDLETVVDAAGVERFALLGISQGCAVSIGYAVRHPERVTHLILHGGYALGSNKRVQTEAEREEAGAMLTLMRLGWGQENAGFRQLFTSQFIPGGTKEQADWFNELQRVSASPADAVRNLKANGEIDVTALLSKVSVPTLVMHARDDARVPFDAGRRLAAGIPGARFVSLQSRNHLILENEPAFGRFVQEIRAFLAS
ncbi:MAG TPA: alpha/beta fold hydrolase [Xanthobacteraceae bacterium]|nr:alpha/beta fold hydrolase [Xanthobacteraceae bacterium]